MHEGRVALHWHRKNGMWLPAGGHLEPGEDPVTATLREVREEFDIEAEIIDPGTRVRYEGGPTQIPPPFTILICHPEPGHEHVDMVYFCRALSGYPGRSHDPENPIIWFDRQQLEHGTAYYNGAEVPFPPDVRALAIEAIRVAESLPEEAVALARGAP